uniref:CSON005611 protein n=1 Tax=Culicoides sonorensis TaxID=179676 RepID=A0A336KDN1_CULSO
MRLLNLILCLFYVISLFGFIQSYRILGLFIHPGRSHYVVFNPLMKGLAAKGHNVTVVSYFPEKENSVPNYKDLPFENQLDLTESFNISRYTPMDYWSHWREAFELAAWGKIACKEALASKVIDQILAIHQSDPFDIVITEFFDTDCHLGVIYKMGVPFIGLSSCALMPWHTDRIATPSTPSFIASEFVGFTEKMSYYERFVSFTVTIGVKYLYRILVERSDNLMLYEKFGHGIPDVNEIALNTSLILVNQHFTLHQARPQSPNLIEIGGIHINENGKKLPSDIQKILDTAQNGVILMSWGSMVNASTMSPEIRQVFLDVFQTLNQTIIWKYETEFIPNKPKNVILKKWIQQRDILCHPNVKIFINHGGMLGTTESIYCGVPVITIPFYGDQPLNGAAMEYRGIGVKINYDEISRESIMGAIRKLLTDEVQSRADSMSKVFKDRPMQALDTAIYWTEYVIRTKGEFIRSYARHMTWFVYYSLDILIPLILLLSLILTIFIKILTVILRKLKGKGNPRPKKKTKKH